MRALAAAFTAGLTAAAAAAACARAGAPPVAPVEVAVADLGDAGPVSIAIAPAPPAARDRCSARLTASTIKTAPGCTLDERLSKDPGLLLYPCSGTGPAAATFGEHQFNGTMKEGSMLLNLTTEIDWEDGCHWQTEQSITGELTRGAKKAKLAWAYSEGPVTGTNCYGSCKATAEIAVIEDSSSGR